MDRYRYVTEVSAGTMAATLRMGMKKMGGRISIGLASRLHVNSAKTVLYDGEWECTAPHRKSATQDTASEMHTPAKSALLGR
jgi:hypothetical protein